MLTFSEFVKWFINLFIVTFIPVPGEKRNGVIVFYWLIDNALTNERCCISRDVPWRVIPIKRRLFF